MQWGRGGEIEEWLLSLLGRMTVRLSQAAPVPSKLEFVPAAQPHHGASATTPHTTITAPFGGWSSKPAPQYPLARKQASELNLGWNRMSKGADCRAGRRGWEEAAERERKKSSCDAPITDQLGPNCRAAMPTVGGTRSPSR